MAKKPDFETLWNAYADPDNPDEWNPCNQDWSNQCAIRMSIALNSEGTLTVDAGTYSEPKCRHGHARGAESLANWLWKKLDRPSIYVSGSTAKGVLADRTGLIFFKNCFLRAGQTSQLGDHIDLWRTGATKGYDDPGNNAQQVWFWELA